MHSSKPLVCRRPSNSRARLTDGTYRRGTAPGVAGVAMRILVFGLKILATVSANSRILRSCEDPTLIGTSFGARNSIVHTHVAKSAAYNKIAEAFRRPQFRWVARKHVPDKITDRKVLIKWQMGTAEGPTASNFAFDTGLLAEKGAEQFGASLAFCVNASRLQWIRGATVGLRNVRDFGRLSSVNRSRTGEKKLSCPVCRGKLERVLRSGYDSRKHL